MCQYPDGRFRGKLETNVWLTSSFAGTQMQKTEILINVTRSAVPHFIRLAFCLFDMTIVTRLMMICMRSWISKTQHDTSLSVSVVLLKQKNNTDWKLTKYESKCKTNQRQTYTLLAFVLKINGWSLVNHTWVVQPHWWANTLEPSSQHLPPFLPISNICIQISMVLLMP